MRSVVIGFWSNHIVNSCFVQGCRWGYYDDACLPDMNAKLSKAGDGKGMERDDLPSKSMFVPHLTLPKKIVMSVCKDGGGVQRRIPIVYCVYVSFKSFRCSWHHLLHSVLQVSENIVV